MDMCQGSARNGTQIDTNERTIVVYLQDMD